MTGRFWALLIAAAAMAPAVPAAAVTAPADMTVATAGVLVGGRQVALLGPAGGLTALQRAEHLRGALSRALGAVPPSALRAEDVHVRVINRLPVVAVRGVPVATATEVDGRLTGLGPNGTAEAWARELRAGLAAGTGVAIVAGTAVFHGGGAGSGAVVR